MSEKWLLSRCEGYEVRIDEVSAGLQAPVIGQRTGDEWGSRGIPGPVFGSFLLVQKGTRTGVRNILLAPQRKTFLCTLEGEMSFFKQENNSAPKGGVFSYYHLSQ